MKKPINIYIVDDSKLFSLALKANLETVFENLSIKVHLFETGEKCMERFRREMPGLVILDYHLNSRYRDAADGLEVLTLIKKINSETTVIMLTSEDHLAIAIKSIQHGACDYVLKNDTQFTKINYAVLNCVKMMDARSYKLKYKYSLAGALICLGLLVIGIIAILIYNSYGIDI